MDPNPEVIENKQDFSYSTTPKLNSSASYTGLMQKRSPVGFYRTKSSLNMSSTSRNSLSLHAVYTSKFYKRSLALKAKASDEQEEILIDKEKEVEELHDPYVDALLDEVKKEDHAT